MMSPEPGAVPRGKCEILERLNQCDGSRPVSLVVLTGISTFFSTTVKRAFQDELA